MKRVVFVTVGTTALTAEHLGELSNSDPLVQKEARDFCRSRKAPHPSLFARVVSAHREFWDSPKSVHLHATYTSAEMTSTWLMFRVQIESFKDLLHPGQDRVVLIASGTPEGEFSARVNAELMDDYIFAPRCPCKVDFEMVDSCDSVFIEVIKGMEAKRGGFDGLPAALDALVNKHTQRPSDIWFNITGGYKGAVPAITSKRPPRSALFYAHESMDTAEIISFAEGGISQVTVPVVP